MLRTELAAVLLLMAIGVSEGGECLPENIPPTDPTLCCNLENVMDRQVVSQCKLKYGDTMRPLIKDQQSVPSGCCFSECVLNTTAIVRNGEVDTVFATNYLTQRVPDPNMAQVIRRGVTACAQEVIQHKEEFDIIANLPPPPNGQRICNPLSGHFLGCIYSYFFRNCPDTRWVGNMQCQVLKDYFNQCPLPFPIQAE